MHPPPSTADIFSLSELASDPKICRPPKFSNETSFYILASIYFALGVMMVTSGYRYYKSSMFTAGFTCASCIVYVLCIQEKPQYANHVVYVKLVACLAGLLCGLLAMMIQNVGIIVSGMTIGLVIGIPCLPLYNHMFDAYIPFTSMQAAFIFLAMGIICCFLNLYFKKGMFIVCTSVSGSAYIFLSLDFFINNWATVIWVMERIKRVPFIFPPCLTSWLLISLLPCFAIVGLVIQWILTGTGIHHEQSLAAQKRRTKTAPLHLTREQRAEMRQRKYRYLYQVRTAHGDVISQSYVQALQQKTSSSEPWNAGGECSTLQSDSTHLTVLASEAPHPDSDEDSNQIRACH